MLWRGLCFDRANVIFAAYFLLRDNDTHIDFLQLLFQVGMIYPSMQDNYFHLF